MNLRYLNPTKYEVVCNSSEGPEFVTRLKRACTYKDKRVQFQLRRAKAVRWRDNSAAIAELEAKETTCLYAPDCSVPAGLVPYLVEKFPGTTISGVPAEDRSTESFHWAVEPPSLRPYQTEAYLAAMEAGHCAIDMPTGSGKSLVAVYLVRWYGAKTVVMAPSINIANQLYADFSKYLGRSRVGKFYDGHKDPEKLVVVAVAASLTKVERNSLPWQILSTAKLFIADEAHRTPAATLEKVCFGLMAYAPWRIFLSATQLREDGLDLLLKAITGKVVFQMTLQDGVNAGFLARPKFKMVEYVSTAPGYSKEPMEMNRQHLMHNPQVMRIASQLIRNAVAVDSPVLVLIDEVQQFNLLLRFLPVDLLKHTAFAHGPVKKGDLPEIYMDGDSTRLVAEFNAGKHKVLVGTSCISEGTDVRPVKMMLYLKGGKSEIDVRQSLGRCTRRVEGKDSCVVVDFDPINIDLLHRHAAVRKKIYNEVCPPVDIVRRRW